jgi:hypothetical protein
MVSIDWVVIAFVLGALTGHLTTRKASLAGLYRVHLRGIEKGRLEGGLEQTEVVMHLQRVNARLQEQVKVLTFKSTCTRNEQLPNIPR